MNDIFLSFPHMFCIFFLCKFLEYQTSQSSYLILTFWWIEYLYQRVIESFSGQVLFLCVQGNVKIYTTLIFFEGNERITEIMHLEMLLILYNAMQFWDLKMKFWLFRSLRGGVFPEEVFRSLRQTFESQSLMKKHPFLSYIFLLPCYEAKLSTLSPTSK